MSKSKLRGIQLSFSNTQKLRLEKALEQLESISSKLNSNATVIVADTIPVDEDAALKLVIAVFPYIFLISVPPICCYWKKASYLRGRGKVALHSTLANSAYLDPLF